MSLHYLSNPKKKEEKLKKPLNKEGKVSPTSNSDKDSAKIERSEDMSFFRRIHL